MKTNYLTLLVFAIALGLCLGADAVPTAPNAPDTISVNIDFESGALGMVGQGSGATWTWPIVGESAPFTTGEDSSVAFTKPDTAGYIFLYSSSGTAPDTLGYVIESVFRVNSSHSASGMIVLKSFQMSAGFWANATAGDTMFDLVSWQSGLQTIQLSTDQWHTIQGVRVNAGAGDYMDYFIDGVYWRSSGEGITTGVYAKRMDIGFDSAGSDYGSMNVDHLMIYYPAPTPPYVPSPYGEWDDIGDTTGDDCEEAVITGWFGQGSNSASTMEISDTQAHSDSQSYRVGSKEILGGTLTFNHSYEYNPDTFGYGIGCWFFLEDNEVEAFRLFYCYPDGEAVHVYPDGAGGSELRVWRSGLRTLPITAGEWHKLEFRRVSDTKSVLLIDDRVWQSWTETAGVYPSTQVTIGANYWDTWGFVYYDDFFIRKYNEPATGYYFYSDMEAFNQFDSKWAGAGTLTEIDFYSTTEDYAYAGVGSLRYYKTAFTGGYFFLYNTPVTPFQVPELGPDGYTASCMFYVPTVAEQLASAEGVVTDFDDLRLFKCADVADTDVRTRNVIIQNAAYEDPANPGGFIDVLFPFTDIDSSTHVKVGAYVDGTGMQSMYVTRGEWHKVTFHRESENNTNIYINTDLLAYYSNWTGAYLNRLDLPSSSAYTLGEVFIDEVIVQPGGMQTPAVAAAIDKAVRVSWAGDANADYRVEYNDGGGWIELATVTGNEYVDEEVSDPSARTYRITRLPKTYFNEDCEGVLTSIWQHDATVGVGTAPFGYENWYSVSPVNSLYLADQTVSDFSNGHTNPGFAVGVPHTLSFNVFIEPNGDEFLNYTLMSIATTGPGVHDLSVPPRQLTDVHFEIESGFANGSTITMTMTYGDGLGDTTASTALIDIGSWNAIVVERTAVGAVSVKVNGVYVLTDVAPIDGSAGDPAQTLWIGQLFGSATQDSKGHMFLDDIVINDIVSEVQVTPVNAGEALTVSFETSAGWQYTVWAADEVGGVYSVVATYTGTGSVITYADVSTAGITKRFYKVSVAMP